MPDDTWLNFECATMQLWTGDLEGYRTTRRNILEYWERCIPTQNSSADMFARALWLACMADPDDDTQKGGMKNILAHTEKIREGLHVEAVDQHPKTLQIQIRAATLYRFGLYEDARTLFQNAAILLNQGKTDSSAFDYQHPKEWAYFFLAMTEHRLGNAKEAQRLFKLGESRLPGDMPSKENPVFEFFVGGEMLSQWILHGEAKVMIFGE